MKKYQYILTYNSTNYTLTHNPAGWKDLSITYLRNEFYHSVLRSFTLSLRFPNVTGGGYSVIKAAYDAEGIYASVGVQIKVRNPNTNAYDALFTGVIDFNPDKFSIEKDYIEASIIDSSKLQKFISRDTNEINLFATKSIDDVTIVAPTKKTIQFTPIDIITKSIATLSKTENKNWSSFHGQNFYYSNPTYIVNQISGVAFSNVAQVYSNDGEQTRLITTHFESSFRIYGTLIFSGYGTIYCNHNYKCFNASGVVTHTVIMDHIEINTTSSPQNFDVSKTIDTTITDDVEPNGYIEIYVVAWLAGGLTDKSIDFTQVETNTVSFTEKTSGKTASDSLCVSPLDAFKAGIGILTSETNTSKLLNSSVLDTGGEALGDVIQNGFMIRNYPDAPLSVKFRDLFKSFDATNNLGFGYDKVNDVFIIEPKAYFFDASVQIADLGEVSNFKRQPLSNGYFSKISGGFNNSGDYERVQGALEFAVSREYSAAATVKETCDAKSEYRYDSVGIEELRNKQYMENANEDNNSDGDVFIVRSTYAGGKYYPSFPAEADFPLDAKGNDVFYSYYNLMLTPRQNAVRWGNIIKACHYKSTKPFKAQKTDKLFELEIGAGYTDENSDIALTELSDALFIPELYTFDGYINNTIIQAIDANPHGIFIFSFNGVNYNGFIDKVELNPYGRKAKFQLIAAEIPPFNFIFEENIDADYIFEENVNANKTFE